MRTYYETLCACSIHADLLICLILFSYIIDKYEGQRNLCNILFQVFKISHVFAQKAPQNVI